MERTITVKGVGLIRRRPDRVELPVTVTARDGQYDLVMERADSALKALREALAPLGFSGEELRTTEFSVSPCWDSQPDERGVYRQVFAGWECRHRLRLAFDFDKERLGEVLSALAESEARPEFYVRFTVGDPEGARTQLLAEAAADARKKAEALCAAAGVSLGTLLRMEHGARTPELYSPTNLALADAAPAAGAMGKLRLSVEPEDVAAEDSAVFIWEIH